MFLWFVDNRLFDQVNTLKSENLQLSIQLEKRRQGIEAVRSGDGASVTNEKLLTLEEKLLAQQEELTEIHKKRGENAQMIVDLKNSLAEKDKLLSMKEDALVFPTTFAPMSLRRFVLESRNFIFSIYSLTESMSVIASLNAEIKMYQANHKQLEDLYQLLKDEYQALQLTSTKLEEKLRKTQVCLLFDGDKKILFCAKCTSHFRAMIILTTLRRIERETVQGMKYHCNKYTIPLTSLFDAEDLSLSQNQTAYCLSSSIVHKLPHNILLIVSRVNSMTYVSEFSLKLGNGGRIKDVNAR